MKKLLMVLSFTLLLLPAISAQDSSNDSISTFSENEEVLIKVEQMPVYPGGNKALRDYLIDNIKYPKEAVEKKIEGKVILTFVVSKEGKVENVKIKRSLTRECDKEAVRVVRNMPTWIPGVQDGKIVSVQYTLPITFKFPKEIYYEPIRQPRKFGKK